MNITPFEHTNRNNSARSNQLSFDNFIIFIDVSSCIFLVFGNFFIIALIRKKRLLGRSTNVFIFSIAVADFLNGSVCIPIRMLFLCFDESITVYLCKGFRFMTYMSKTVVPYTILFMTAEKTMRILCPTREIVTVARCMFFTSLLWFFASSFNIWCVVLFTTIASPNTTDSETHNSTLKVNVKQCLLNPRFAFLHTPFLVLDSLILFIIPILSILGCYIVLFIKYFTILRERISTYFFVIKLLLALSVNVLITHLPFEVKTFLENKRGFESVEMQLLFGLFTSFYFTRGIWNLVIYGYFKHYVCRKQSLASIRAGNSNTKPEFAKFKAFRNQLK